MKIKKIWSVDAQQKIFGAMMDAMSFPGKVKDISKFLDEENALNGIVATLVDGAASLADPNNMMTEEVWNFTQTVKLPAEQAAYIVCEGELEPVFMPVIGTLENPEKGATLVIKVASLICGESEFSCAGPGIKERTKIKVNGLHKSWFDLRRDWNLNFPLGIDFIICDDCRLIALPRTTTITGGN